MISAVVLTKNEEKNIENCINSLIWCHEIIVIDDFSEDKTLEIIERFNEKKIKIYKRELNEDFAAQRNYGISKVKGNWVLFIDADEVVTDSLQYEIVGNINSSLENISGFFVKRNDFIWGKMLNFGESYNNNILRLARKNTGEWIGRVHEVWDIKGKTRQLKSPLIHFPHQSIKLFLEEINYYTDLRAKELFHANKKTNILHIVLFTLGKFISNYFLKLGVLDGTRGLISALIMSLHSFLSRGKLWKLWEEKKA